MKKLVIVTNKMVIGGIEKSLIELLNLLSAKYEVTLILNSTGGELFDKIPTNVHIKKMIDSSNLISRFKNTNTIKEKIKLLFYTSLVRITGDFRKECEYLTKIYKKDEESYDLAIAYSTPVSLSNSYVINNINAKKKVMFLHNDVKEISISPLTSKKQYSKFDRIYAVSKHARNSFLDYFPEYSEKVKVFHNIINEKEIINLSNEKNEISDKKGNEFHICTIGRVEYEKGQDIIPSVLYELKKYKKNIKWHIVGDGTIIDKIKEDAKKKHVLDMIVFEGYQSNPYKYLKQSDLYIQTSRQEGFGITISEAKILKKLIITTNFPCAYEQIDNFVNGIIVEFDCNSLCNTILEVMDNDKLREKLEFNARNYKYDSDYGDLIDYIERG